MRVRANGGGGGNNDVTKIDKAVVSAGGSKAFTIDASKNYILTACLNYGVGDNLASIVQVNKGVYNAVDSGPGNFSFSYSAPTLTLNASGSSKPVSYIFCEIE